MHALAASSGTCVQGFSQWEVHSAPWAHEFSADALDVTAETKHHPAGMACRYFEGYAFGASKQRNHRQKLGASRGVCVSCVCVCVPSGPKELRLDAPAAAPAAAS